MQRLPLRTVTDEQTFWDELSRAIEERRPMAWRRPLAAPLSTPAEVFGWCVSGARAFARGDRRTRFRLFGETAELPSEPVLMPTAADATFEGYFARLAPRHGDAALIINDLQASGRGAYRTVREVFAPLQARLGAPAGGASFELFAGAYRRGAFGIHKDDQDVITFVMKGKKRFLAWPYERFESHPLVVPGSHLRPVSLPDFDDTVARAEALVIEGEPGDVFYWPAEWWHLAESDGELCVTISAGLSQGITLAKLLEECASEDEGGAPSPMPRTLPVSAAPGPPELGLAATSALFAALQEADMQRRLEEKMLAAASAFGCRSLPEPAPAGERPPLPAWARAFPGSIRFFSDDETLTWAVCGSIFRFPNAGALRALLGEVASGRTFAPAALAARLADEEVDEATLRYVLGLMQDHDGILAA